ncbi:ankyrin repeat domain-containing protein, partial [Candidatus Bathyarchaeota archaeon]|nr:ankyrin repeat domain-containing protein [Candidatus Bathyarchaeota archaeon]
MPVDATIKSLFAHHGRGGESVSDGPNTRSITLPSIQVQSLATSAGLRRVTAEISKFMPEREEGENIARVQALAGGDPVELKKQEIQLFVYQLSNNLIQDEERGDDVTEDRFRRIVGLFHKLDLPLVAWKRYFAQSRGEATSSAFVEKLFEAAVVTRELGLCEVLLESGADPDKVIYSTALAYSAGKPGLVRPIQHSVERGVRDAALAKLLIRFGAGVELTTKADEWPAILKAAKNGMTEGVRALVEAGADIRAAYIGLGQQSWITHDTVLSRAAGSEWRRRHWHDGEEDDPDGCGQLRGYSCLEYLLPLYDRERDGGIIQSALLVAARRHRTDMIPLLLEAGGDMAGTNAKGYTPLIAAVNACRDGNGVPAVQLLLDLGADPDGASGQASRSALQPLHLAAAQGEPELVALLVERGADVDALAFTGEGEGEENHRGTTPADLCVETSRPATPLFLALSSFRCRDLIRASDQAAVALCLLRAGAGLIGGELAYAARLESAELVRELLDRG